MLTHDDRQMALDIIGLNDTEQVVYRAVVAGGPVTAQQLADLAGASNKVVRLAIVNLVDKGLVAQSVGSPAQYTAAPPDIALEALLLGTEQRVKRARMDAQRLMSEYQRRFQNGDPVRLVELVAGRDAVLQRFDQIQRATRHQVRMIDKPPYLAEKPEDNLPLQRELCRRGVRCRGIYDPEGLETFHSMEGDVQAFIDAGEESRVLPGAPFKLMLSDDRIGMIPLQAAPIGIDSIVVVHQSALLTALSVMFEQLWLQAMPLEMPTDGFPGPGPTGDERQMLRLLITGLTDETIAKQLGISHRTMQRRLRGLFERLGVHTRFQAAYRAVEMGWLPSNQEVAPPPTP